MLSEALREATVTGEVCVKWPGWQAVPSTATAHLIGGFASCQTTELCDAILEGYPKSKKQFFVSDFPLLLPWDLCPGDSSLLSFHRKKLG